MTGPLPERGRIRLDLGVPAYAHPLVEPELWIRLAASVRHLRFVVVNVNSGPGHELDLAYPPVIERLRAARARMVGYIATHYGGSEVEDVVAQARLWITRYGVRGVFLDQVAGDFEHLEYYTACAVGARAAGAQFVVLNPGTDCHPGYADLANVTVTFEGTWSEYRRHRTASWTLTRPATRFCHLLYDVPPGCLDDGLELVATRHVSTVFLTDGCGDNPWDRLPEPVLAAVRRAHPTAVAAPFADSPGWGGRRYAIPARADGSEPPAAPGPSP